MSKFGPPAFQAVQVMKQLQVMKDETGQSVIKSVGTVRNFEQGLTKVAEFMDINRMGSLLDTTKENISDCLVELAQDYSQSLNDMVRQASEVMMQHVTHKLAPGEKLPRVFSENPAKMSGRSYSNQQFKEIVNRQFESNALASEIARFSGSRAHEILTVQLASEKPADHRPISEHKFKNLNGVRYTVTGKGGLTREIVIRKDLSDRLEARRLDTPRIVVDRGIIYKQHYDISGGQRFSNSFTQASNRALGFSRGAHGLRHSYAQERMNTLQCLGLTREDALRAVSQEMGHFRPEIVEVYLR